MPPEVTSTPKIDSNPNVSSFGRVEVANSQINQGAALDAARDLSSRIVGAVRDSGRVDTGSADFQSFAKLVESGLTKIAGGDAEGGKADLTQAMSLLSKLLQPQEGEQNKSKPESNNKPENTTPTTGTDQSSNESEEDDPIMQFLKALVDALKKAGMDPQAIKQLLQQLKPALEKLGVSGDKIESLMQSLGATNNGSSSDLTSTNKVTGSLV